ncbi:MAG: phosphoribosylanthranilate isomerase [Candidatus Omnitrophica bacterium]|nr:phosphoribosylanthranilate isomerase [Candidatus Omnitrophota bacterium]
MLKVKICGITQVNDALHACQYGGDALGFIFAKSPRIITPQKAKEIIKRVPEFIAKVGVFVNADRALVLHITRECKLDTLQFHGEESDKYCAFFKKYCKIIKAFRIKDTASIKAIKKYTSVDAYLFDSYSNDFYGGTGYTFSHSLLKNESFNKPIIIAGGINEKNYGKIANLLHPFAFDISSSIESSPGKKDLIKMKNLIKRIKLL